MQKYKMKQCFVFFSADKALPKAFHTADKVILQLVEHIKSSCYSLATTWPVEQIDIVCRMHLPTGGTRTMTVAKITEISVDQLSALYLDLFETLEVDNLLKFEINLYYQYDHLVVRDEIYKISIN